MTKQKKELPLWMQLQVVSSYSRGWALLLCLCGFFMIGGLHRFYVRRWISGILYLLTGGVFMVGTLYDLIQILRGEFDDDCGLHLESALRKRWDDRHAVWRYIGSTPGVGRYYINRDTIDHSVPNQVTCSFLVKINSLGAAAMKSHGMPGNVVYGISRVCFENDDGSVYVTPLEGEFWDKTKCIMQRDENLGGAEYVDPNSMHDTVYQAAYRF